MLPGECWSPAIETLIRADDSKILESEEVSSGVVLDFDASKPSGWCGDFESLQAFA